MPDSWGRPTGQDWLGLGLMARQMGETTRNRQEDRQVESVLQAYNAGGLDATMPEGVSATAQSKGLGMYRKGEEDRAAVGRADLDRDTLAARKRLVEGMAAVGEDPAQRLAYLNSYSPRTLPEMRAVTGVAEELYGQTNFSRGILENDIAKGAKQYEALQPIVQEAGRAVQAGDPAKAGRLLEGAGDQALTRWRVRYNEQTGSMDELHLEREQGWVPTGRSMSVQEVLDLAGKTTQRDYAVQAAAQMATTREFNVNELKGGGVRAVGPEGQELRAYSLIDLNGFGGRDFVVFDKKGGLVGKFDEASFLKSGIRVEPKTPAVAGGVKQQDWMKVVTGAQKLYDDTVKDALDGNPVPDDQDRAEAEAQARKVVDRWLSVTVGPGVTMDNLSEARWGGGGGSASPGARGLPGYPGAGGGYGLRPDGTPKGKGFFGELSRPDGKISTELSIGVDFDGEETQIPLLVPTLTRGEIASVLSGKKPTKQIVDKAVAHAKMRMAQGKSPFAQEGEQVQPPPIDPPDEVLQELKTNDKVTVRNKETGEVLTWVKDPVTGTPVLMGR